MGALSNGGLKVNFPSPIPENYVEQDIANILCECFHSCHCALDLSERRNL